MAASDSVHCKAKEKFMSLHKANTLLGMTATPVILAYGRLKQEDHESLANLSYIARFCLKNKKQNKKQEFEVMG